MAETIGNDELWDELIDGKTVAMEPRPSVKHNIVSSSIYAIFHNYLDGSKDVPLASGVDLYLDENNRFIPDIMVVCNRGIIQDDGVHGAPDLAVEVLSPSTADRDKGYKKKAYERAGVKEYWIVDPAKSVEVYTPNNETLGLNAVHAIAPEAERDHIKDTFQCGRYADLALHQKDIFGRIW